MKSYYIIKDDQWTLIEDSRSGYIKTEKFTHCAACHTFLSGYDGPREALCVRCFEENKHTRFNLRNIFGQ